MAVWLTALQIIPWKEVIKHAPAVAEGAQKLWSTVSKRTPLEAPPESPPAPEITSPEAQAVAALDSRLVEATSAIEALQEQMLQSSAVIKDLAAQNAQLILRVESTRRRLLWLAVVTAASGLVALVAVGLALT